jgi:hypothetical protein
MGRSDQICPEVGLRHNLVNACRHTLEQQIILKIIMFGSVLNLALSRGGLLRSMTAGPQVCDGR